MYAFFSDQLNKLYSFFFSKLNILCFFNQLNVQYFDNLNIIVFLQARPSVILQAKYTVLLQDNCTLFWKNSFFFLTKKTKTLEKHNKKTTQWEKFLISGANKPPSGHECWGGSCLRARWLFPVFLGRRSLVNSKIVFIISWTLWVVTVDFWVKIYLERLLTPPQLANDAKFWFVQ